MIRQLPVFLAATMVLLLSAGCAGSGPGASPPATSDIADDVWRRLARPRPAPLPGAPRLSFAGFELTGSAPWDFAGPLGPELALSELVVAGLLRRPDVQLVERRRFMAAAEAARSGQPRRPGAPPAGVSPGAELVARVIWLPLGGGQVVLEVRISGSETAAIAGSHRMVLPASADMVATARSTVASVLAGLDEMGRLPEWDDPVPDAAPDAYRPSGIGREAVQRFLRGLAAEELWNWEDARRSYEAAAASDGFLEAEAALARTARLRNGGTLGES